MQPPTPTPVPEAVWNLSASNAPVSLGELTESAPVLLVFLRHFGCSFCRESLHDLSRNHGAIRERGVALGLVHLASETTAHQVLSPLGLDPVPRWSDPEKHIYQAFGLRRGKVLEIFGPKVALRGLLGGAILRYGFEHTEGDPRQMPGVFLLEKRTILSGFIHASAADRPDYCRFIDRFRR